MEKIQVQTSQPFEDILLEEIGFEMDPIKSEHEEDPLACCLRDEQRFQSIKGMGDIKVKSEPSEEFFTTEIEIEEHAIKLEPEDELDCLPQDANASTSSVGTKENRIVANFKSNLYKINCTNPEISTWHIKNCHGKNAIVKIVKIREKLLYWCQLCNILHTGLEAIVPHLLYKHQINNWPFRCTSCDITFMTKQHFKEHKLICKTAHDKPNEPVNDKQPTNTISSNQTTIGPRENQLDPLHPTIPAKHRRMQEGGYGTSVPPLTAVNTLELLPPPPSQNLMLQHKTPPPFLQSGTGHDAEDRADKIEKRERQTNLAKQQTNARVGETKKKLVSRNLKCSECGTKYAYHEMLTWHIENCHGPDPKVNILRFGKKTYGFQCVLCKTEFKNEIKFIMRHLHKEHNVSNLPYRCKFCNFEQFILRKSLLKHELVCGRKIESHNDHQLIDQRQFTKNFLGPDHSQIQEDRKGMSVPPLTARNTLELLPPPHNTAPPNFSLQHMVPSSPSFRQTETGLGKDDDARAIKGHEVTCDENKSQHSELRMNEQSTNKDAEARSIKVDDQLDFSELQNTDGERPLENQLAECRVLVPKLFKCDLCSLVTDNKTQLATHMQARHLKEMQSRHLKKSGRRRPIRHLPEMVYNHKCAHCGIKYVRSEMLTWHTELCHGLDALVTVVKLTKKLHSFHCYLCNSSRLELQLIIQHLRSKHRLGNTPFRCNFCNEHFLLHISLKRHVCKKKNCEGINSEKFVQCKLCGKKLVSAMKMINHILGFHAVKKDLRFRIQRWALLLQ